jgi:hypothetical protein
LAYCLHVTLAPRPEALAPRLKFRACCEIVRSSLDIQARASRILIVAKTSRRCRKVRAPFALSGQPALSPKKLNERKLRTPATLGISGFNFGSGLRETGVLSETAGNEMTYRISYDDGLAREAAKRSEYYRTEFEAMRRARQLLEDGDHHGIALHDGSGSVLTGIRLELKLGMAVTD